MKTSLIDWARKGRKLKGFPVIDSHAHVGHMVNLESPPLETHVAEMDRLGVTVGVVSGIMAINGEFRRGNDDVADAIRRFPGRFLGYCHVSANYPDLMMPELERCFALDGFRGIKVYQVGPAFDSPLFDPVWAFAKERKAPVLAHTWGGGVTGLDKAAEKTPDVIFMAGHSGSGFAYEP